MCPLSIIDWLGLRCLHSHNPDTALCFTVILVWPGDVELATWLYVGIELENGFWKVG